MSEKYLVILVILTGLSTAASIISTFIAYFTRKQVAKTLESKHGQLPGTLDEEEFSPTVSPDTADEDGVARQ